MGTNYLHHSDGIGAIQTSRTLSVTTGVPQIVTLLTSGVILVNFQNLGPNANLTLGDSAMLMGTGDTVFPFASREFYPVSDNFFTYARADSAASVLAITEYGVV